MINDQDCRHRWLSQKGWLRIEVSDSWQLDARIFASAAAALDDADEFALIAIDIPIGLTDRGARDCDVAARKLVGPRRNSVFPAPVRAALRATTYGEAARLSREAHGKSLSQQAFGILRKICEVDDFLCAHPALVPRVREVHPELCFYHWNGQSRLEHPKRSRVGFALRYRLVEAEFPGGYDAVRARFGRGTIANDDILDAFAALWTAKRAVRGVAVTIPPVPPRDRLGLPMEMLA